MDFDIPRMMLGEREADAGLVIAWTCPQCQEPRNFHLIVRNLSLRILDLELSNSDDLHDLRCSSCAYEIKASPSEKPLLEAARKLTESFKAGNLDSTDYRAGLFALSAKFVSDLAALTDEWQCAACGEKCPASFGSCWNCGSHNEDGVDSVGGEESRPDVFPGGNAWEK